MKKLLSGLLVVLLVIVSTGCFKRDNMDGITIHTTVYPIEYIAERLYGDNSSISSIYPDGVIPSSYKFTEKQLKDYSRASLFIFNGLSDEKNYVSEMFSYNKSIKIIDTTVSMEYTYRIEELWLNPSNLLMLAQNIKKGFEEYIDNHYLKNSINEKYETLKIEISNLDASINLMLEEATNKTIVVSSNLFNFLSKYGFEVISLEEDASGKVSDKVIAQVQNLIANKKIDYIFAPNNEDLSDTVKHFEQQGLKIAYLHTLSNITESERINKKDYISIMNDNIEALKNEIYD